MTKQNFNRALAGAFLAGGILLSIIAVFLVNFAHAEVSGQTLFRMLGNVVSPINQTTKMGIGTTTPNAKLTVQGTSGSTNDIINIASSTGSSLFKVAYDGTVTMPGFSVSAITGLKQTYGTAQTGVTQTLATSTADTNLGMTITTGTNSHIFTPYWIGTLADARIASASTWSAKQDAIGYTAMNKATTTLDIQRMSVSLSSSTQQTISDILWLGNGTVNTPSLNIGNTGLYLASSGKLGITNGTSGLTWDGTMFYPNTTNARNLGGTSNLWNNAYINYASTTQITSGSFIATSTTQVSSFKGVKTGTAVVTDASTITVDWALGSTQEVVLGATGRTLAFSNVSPGATLKLWVWQDITGSRTITTYPTGVHWAGGTAPTLTTTGGKFDMLVFTTASSTTQFSAGASLNY
jgi:hypothetical protein